jgi:hypothetical protein
MRLMASSSRLTPERDSRWDSRVCWTERVASALFLAVAALTAMPLMMP